MASLKWRDRLSNDERTLLDVLSNNRAMGVNSGSLTRTLPHAVRVSALDLLFKLTHILDGLEGQPTAAVKPDKTDKA